MALEQAAFDLLFGAARSQNGWQDKPVAPDLLHRLYDLVKLGPTSLNGQPARFVFASSATAKEKLVAAVSPGNVEKTRSAPVVAIIGYDLDFAERLPALFPHNPAVKQLFDGKPAFVQDTAFRNSAMQGAYLILAARGLGLDCGPMSGFDAAKVEAAFFPEGRVKVNFLCGLGYGDAAKLFPRSPRLEFEQACRIE